MNHLLLALSILGGAIIVAPFVYFALALFLLPLWSYAEPATVYAVLFLLSAVVALFGSAAINLEREFY